MTSRIDVIYFDAGSGHRSGALALARALEAEHPVRARAVDILDVIAGHPTFHRTVRTGIDYFNGWLRREQVWDLKGLINLSLLSHDLVSKRGVAAISSYWSDDAPDAVVSVTPMYNRVLADAYRLRRPDGRYIVVPVDFEEGKKRFWFEPSADVDYLLTGDRQREQAVGRGLRPERLHDAGGMIIDPAFYDPPPDDRESALEQMGLDPSRPTALITFGGQGSVLALRCADSLEEMATPLNVVVLCGRNADLRARIEARPTRHLRLALGFTPTPPVLVHHLADVVIGKPGSMTITEAVMTETPIVAIRSRGMGPVQRGNERWVERTGAGEVVDRPADLPAAVARVLGDSQRFARLRGLRHDAVFTAARIVAELAGVESPAVPAR